jgi:hypothetical protein
MTVQVPSDGHHQFRQAYPTADAVRTIRAEEQLHRAVEAYRYFYPVVSTEGIFNGGRELGIEDGKQLMMMAAGPRHLVFTANSDTPYASGALDLAAAGPMVVELPPGPYIGLVNDHSQRWILDMGIPGPDGGQGGKHLVLPPGFGGAVPDGFHVGRSATWKALLALRALPVGGDQAGALEALRRVKVYLLASPTSVLSFVDVSERAMDCTPLRWEDNIDFWRRLHAVVNAEPPSDEDRPMYGELAALGIARGQPFAPDEGMRVLLEMAAQMALDQMRVEGFASERPDRIVWPDRRWEWVGLVPDDANFETRDFLDLQARDRWFVQAIVTSPAMFRRAAGGGSAYFLAARDGRGAFLDGGKTYRLNVPGPVPAKLFWSVTAYDARTRSQVQAAQDRAVLGSLRDTFQPNADGSVDVYLGPDAPAGEAQRKQWIQTVPGRGFFLYFRVYGPEAACLDGSWKLGDLAAIDARELRAPSAPPASRIAPDVLRAISTPDTVETRIGALRFTDGVPAAETAAVVHDNLDLLHGVQSFLSAMPAVSLVAMRRGLLDVGVRDNEVLLFSGLMDARSLFLTANCDTVYFFAFLDLAHGPVVLQVPPRTLGVLDDMWFRWVTDFGMAGPDRGEGGRYLLVPPGYKGPLPEGGYFVSRPSTNHLLMLGRAFLEDDDPAPAAERIRRGLRISSYVPGGVGSSIAAFLDGRAPLANVAATQPPETRFVEGTGLDMNTIPPADHTFFDMLDAVVQLEPAGALEPEVAGHFAALGIVKDRPFRPDERMRRILAEAAALGNATSRAISFSARDGEGFRYYGERSAWMNPLFAGGCDFLRPPPLVTPEGVKPFPNTGARALDARTQFFYLATGITPAMCMRLPGVGSQYIAAFRDAAGRPLDGARSYRVTLPPSIPAALFWSLTVYDNQTRSMLQTAQRFPRAGSQGYPTPAAVAGADGATTVCFAPRRPDGVAEGNWIETVPGKGWFAILRLYSPLEPFFDKSWRPSEIEEAGSA